MKRYTVTITPDDGNGAETIVWLEVTSGVPRVKELRLTAGANGSLSTGQLPEINLEMLLAAVMPATATTTTVSGRPPRAAAAPVIAAPAAITSEPVKKDTPAKKAALPTTKKVTAKPAPKRATKAASKAKAAPKPATKSESTDRIYRSMPEDFVSTYHQAPTVAALAEVYGVPVYTAQNWITTARKRDLIPPARSRARR